MSGVPRMIQTNTRMTARTGFSRQRDSMQNTMPSGRAQTSVMAKMAHV